MEIVLALLLIWLAFVAIGALFTMPAKGWIWILAFLALMLIAMRPSFACDDEQKPPYCWQQADGQIFCENQK